MDHDKIVNKRIRRIAADHSCTVDQVHAALDRHPIEIDRDTFLKRTLAMELVELDEVKAAVREKALVDRDVGHAVQVIQREPPVRRTSTPEIEELIDRIRGIERKPEPDDPDAR